MARVTFAPIVATASGKIAGTVFSRWKGRPYIRTLVIPNNPQSVAQTAQRDAMARIVVLHRWLPALVKTQIDALVAAERMSGYNWFASKNVVDEKTYDTGKIMPHNPACPVVQNFTAAAGAADEIDITWGAPGHADVTNLVVLKRKVETLDEADRLTQVDSYPVGLGAATIAGNDTGELYRIFAFYAHAGNTVPGESDSAECLAG